MYKFGHMQAQSLSFKPNSIKVVQVESFKFSGVFKDEKRKNGLEGL